MMNHELLLTKQKFIKSLLSRYSFWSGLVEHNLQVWTDRGTELSASLIRGQLMPITLSSYEHLTILPLVFDYLDVTIALKFGLRDEPFKMKSEMLVNKLEGDLLSRITISLYENLSKIRNKLLHHKGGLSECGTKVIIIQGQLHVDLNALHYINRLTVFLSRYLEGNVHFSLYEKSLIWSSYKLALPNCDSEFILEAAKMEKVFSINVNCQRFKIDMRSKSLSSFDELKDNLQHRFLNEDGNLICNTLFMFIYNEIQYSVPAEYVYRHSDFSVNDLSIWQVEKTT